jgi:hypothetical protein
MDFEQNYKNTLADLTYATEIQQKTNIHVNKKKINDQFYGPEMICVFFRIQVIRKISF